MSGSGNGKIWTGARADQAELRSCDLLGVGEVDSVKTYIWVQFTEKRRLKDKEWR